VVKGKEVLHVLMNGRLIGALNQTHTGAMTFQYAQEWLETPGARPLSLSLPLRSAAYEGVQVYNFFDNLLPDSKAIRDRIQVKFQARTSQPFDLLSAVGIDCVGAVQLCSQPSWPQVDTVTKKILSEEEIAERLRGYQQSPLGMAGKAEDFRISIAGAQEKTALLKYKGKWCLPSGPTPTSHIFKLPIGLIQNNSIDLSESCENEWLCLEIAKAFGLPVANAKIQQFEEIRVLVVERFDRRWSGDGRWLMRLPQEDLCQALGVAPSRKYQSDGGPGIAEIMNVLLGSKQAKTDREQFFRTQILFWLLAATDGHAKNFSIFLEPSGSYRLTPLYDVISVYPAMKTQAIHRQKAKMAMALRGKQNRYEWTQIQPRHFLSTAKAVNFSQTQAMALLLEMLKRAEAVAKKVKKQLPAGFPTHISDPILNGMVALARQHLPTTYKLR
jgi:serine/threonine-protein kinase HipA